MKKQKVRRPSTQIQDSTISLSRKVVFKPRMPTQTKLAQVLAIFTEKSRKLKSQRKTKSIPKSILRVTKKKRVITAISKVSNFLFLQSILQNKSGLYSQPHLQHSRKLLTKSLLAAIKKAWKASMVWLNYLPNIITFQLVYGISEIHVSWIVFYNVCSLHLF